MYSHAIQAVGPVRAKHRERYDLGSLRQAMTGHRRARGGGRSRHRHGDPGFGPWAGFGGSPFGGAGWGGGPFGRGRKARRGDIRTAALLLLAEQPRNGYQIMQEVEERSDGVWRPSPGSVYPALQQLEDEGLIRSEEIDGRKLYAITEEGRAQLERRDPQEPAPWEQMSGDVSDQAFELAKLMREVASAFAQVMRTGSEAQLKRARELLVAARRDLYRILADGDSEAAGAGEAEE
jgi:DNA-binding PadR family transcriptional regulator